MLMSSVACLLVKIPFSTGTKIPTTWTPFVSLKQWVCKWDQPTRVRCGMIQLWRRSCDSREKVGQRKKDGDNPAEKFRKTADSLSVCHGCLLYGARVVIPTKLRRQVLDLLHECLFGIQRMKQLARAAVYWPNIDIAILDPCRQCSTCAEHQSEPSKAAVHPWMLPEKPWSRLHIDHAINFLGFNWLVVTDAYTKYPCIHATQSVSAKSTIELLQEDFGFPHTVVTDCAATF